MTTSSVSSAAHSSQKSRFLLSTNALRENITGWVFISPALLIIAVFGLFPIGYAVFMSLYRWRIQRRAFEDDFLGIGNYTRIVGHWQGALLFVVGFIALYSAYLLWNDSFQDGRKNSYFYKALVLYIPRMYGQLCAACGAGILIAGVILRLSQYTDPNGVGTANSFLIGVLLLCIGGALYFGANRFWKQIAEKWEDPSTLVRLGLAFAALILAFYAIGAGWAEMMEAGDKDFLEGLTRAFWYTVITVPFELALGLILAYVLFQNIKGKQWYRVIFFLPYVAPDVAMAVVFNIVFTSRETGLANSVLRVFHIPPQRWLYEPDSMINMILGTDLKGFLAGPSMALFSIAILSIWKYVGYNAIIFLAGLGSIPKDLYEAAKVDGATEWHLFRYITLPLLSPVTFYLAILAFIGTFQSFNSIYVMREAQAQGTVDVATIVIFDTFYKAAQYGLAAAQAIVLFLCVLALTQSLRNVLEKRVFYG